MPEKIRPIVEIAEDIGLKEDELELYVRFIAKAWFTHTSSGI
jgi:formyltetrahydrofolate synthetase